MRLEDDRARTLLLSPVLLLIQLHSFAHTPDPPTPPTQMRPLT